MSVEVACGATLMAPHDRLDMVVFWSTCVSMPDLRDLFSPLYLYVYIKKAVIGEPSLNLLRSKVKLINFGF